MHRGAAVAVVLVLNLAALGWAADHRITPADYSHVAHVGEVAISPDGKLVAYTLSTWDVADDSRKGDLWVVATDGKTAPVRLSVDRASDRHPRWTADRASLLVLGKRKRVGEKQPPYNGSAQVWRLSLSGGDPRPVTRVAGGIAAFEYSPTLDAIFYITEETTHDQDAFSKLRRTYEKAEYGHGSRKISRLYRLNLGDGSSEVLLSPQRYIRDFTITPDGKKAALVTAIDDSVLKSEGESRVDIYDVDAKKLVTPPTECYRQAAASPYAWLEGLAWSPKGTRFAFVAIFDGYPARIVVGSQSTQGWTTENLALPEKIHVHGYGSPLRWTDEESLVFLGEADGAVGVIGQRIGKSTHHGVIKPGVVTSAFDVSMTGHLVAVRGSSTELPEIVAGALWTEGRSLTALHRYARNWKMPTVEHITWTAPDGTRVGGALELPAGYEKGTKLPLVVAIHGGPTTSSKADLSFDPHNGRLYFAAAGYAVLVPNYRGSTGYGDKFVTDLIGQENDLDVKDILSGIQHLIKTGIADPDRVGVMGWSNGGYLTNCLITMKNPPVAIRAASSGAGIVDTVAEWGFNDEPAYPMVLKKGLPWEQPAIYKKTSPTYGLGNVTTPTLIHVGGNDERCPPGHSRMLYRALREYQKVPTELVVYKGEPHGLGKLSNRRAKMEWDLAWFEKYLKGR